MRIVAVAVAVSNRPIRTVNHDLNVLALGLAACLVEGLLLRGCRMADTRGPLLLGCPAVAMRDNVDVFLGHVQLLSRCWGTDGRRQPPSACHCE